VLVWAEPITDVALGSGYEDSVGVLRALAPFMFLLGTGTFITLAVNYVGEASRRIWVSIATLALCAAIDIALLPTIGVVGAAIAMDVAFTGYVLGHFWICRRVFDFSVEQLVLALVRCLVAAAAMAGTLALFGTSSLSPIDWVAGAIAGIAVYAMTLVVTREVTRDEIRSLVAQLRPGAA
jgi:O-antigen/teichoic acid export membrane protein